MHSAETMGQKVGPFGYASFRGYRLRVGPYGFRV